MEKPIRIPKELKYFYILLKLSGLLAFKFNWDRQTFTKSTYEKLQIILIIAFYIFIYPQVQKFHFRNISDEIMSPMLVVYFSTVFKVMIVLSVILHGGQLVFETELMHFFNKILSYLKASSSIVVPLRKSKVRRMATLRATMLLTIFFTTAFGHAISFMKVKGVKNILTIMLLMAPLVLILLLVNAGLTVAVILNYEYKRLGFSLSHIRVYLKTKQPNKNYTIYQRTKKNCQASEIILQLMSLKGDLDRLRKKYNQITGCIMAYSMITYFCSALAVVSAQNTFLFDYYGYVKINGLFKKKYDVVEHRFGSIFSDLNQTFFEFY
jgi:hypothetical protein